MSNLAQLLIAFGIGFPTGLAIEKWLTPRVRRYHAKAQCTKAEIKRLKEDDR